MPAASVRLDAACEFSAVPVWGKESSSTGKLKATKNLGFYRGTPIATVSFFDVPQITDAARRKKPQPRSPTVQHDDGRHLAVDIARAHRISGSNRLRPGMLG